MGISKPSTKKTAILTWGVTVLIIIAIVLVIIYASNREVVTPIPPKKTLVNIEVITINTEEFVEFLMLPAIVEADRVASIRPEFSGILERWYFPEGAEVQIGDVIAEIDTETFRLNLAELEATLQTASKNVSLSWIKKESAQVNLASVKKVKNIHEIGLEAAASNLELARKQFDRTQTMAQQKIATASQLDDARNALTQSELAVTQAKQSLNSAELNVRAAELAIREAEAGVELAEAKIVELEASIDLLNYKIDNGKLRAPFSGRLEKHLVQPGEMASPDAVIARIYDLKYLRAVVNVPDRYVAFLDPNNESIKTLIQMNMPGGIQRIRASLIVPGLPKLTGGIGSGVELKAEIARIAQSSNPESNTFEVELRLPNPGNALKQGLIVRGRIEYLIYPDGIVIPVKAIQVTDEGPRSLVVEKEDGAEIVRSRVITPVSIHGSNVFIRGGLQAGDRLVVAGWKGLVGGEKVNVLVEDGKFKKLSSE
ncbi:efflux RND transporter periplasmic adaptor subunit [bacterium]|nr:efflux RND transporter periplasmic adaptor subunit [bacterium]